MNDNSLNRLGGGCSILLGVSYLLIGVNYLLLPAEIKIGAAPDQFLPAFAQSPFPLSLQYWLFAVGGILAVAAVQAISRAVQSANEGWVRWTSNLAVIGFAVTALDNFRAWAYWSDRAAEYLAADATAQATLAQQSGLLSLDQRGWFGFGLVGLWVLVVSLLALRTGTLPRGLSYVGVAVTIAYWLVVAGFNFQVEILVAIAAALGGVILGPIWYIWAGLILRRSAQAMPSAVRSPVA